LDIQWTEEELKLIAAVSVELLEKESKNLRKIKSMHNGALPRTNWKNRLY
jgi:hypothetical protein